jgi:hypothetical protein
MAQQFSLINGSAATNVAGSTIAGPNLNVQNANAQITSVSESNKVARREFINPNSTGNVAFITGTTLGAVDNFTKFVDSTPGDQIPSLSVNQALSRDTFLPTNPNNTPGQGPVTSVIQGVDGKYYQYDGISVPSKLQGSAIFGTGTVGFGADNAILGAPQINFKFGRLNATGIL